MFTTPGTFSKLDIARLKFIMTMDCNFRCDYCFEGGKSKNKNLTSEECVNLGRQVLDEMQQDELTILYFGGEPMLRFFDIVTITQLLSIYAKKVNKKIRFTIITNGSILNQRMVNHFKQYHYFVSVSCDGIEAAQNTHRHYYGNITDFKRIDKTIDILNKETSDLCLSMVITKQNVKYLSESFQWAINKGIRNFAMSPVTDNVNYFPDIDVYKQELLKIVKIALPIKERLVINPPLDFGWDVNQDTRKMTKSNNSVNIELSPIKLNIIPEAALITSIDFSLNNKQKKEQVSKSLKHKLIQYEIEVANIYKQGKENI